MNLLEKLGVENTTNINDIHINIEYQDVDGMNHQIFGDIRNDYVSLTKDGVDISNNIDRSNINTYTDFVNIILESDALSDFHTYVGCYINISDWSNNMNIELYNMLCNYFGVHNIEVTDLHMSMRYNGIDGEVHVIQAKVHYNIALNKDGVDLTHLININNINTDTDFVREMYKSGILNDFGNYICSCYINETEDH